MWSSKPGYVQPGGPPLWVAAMSEAGAHREARSGLQPAAAGARGTVLDPWRADLIASGRNLKTTASASSALAGDDDVERGLPAVRAAERYRLEVYLRFTANPPPATAWPRIATIASSADLVVATPSIA